VVITVETARALRHTFKKSPGRLPCRFRAQKKEEKKERGKEKEESQKSRKIFNFQNRFVLSFSRSLALADVESRRVFRRLEKIKQTRRHSRSESPLSLV